MFEEEKPKRKPKPESYDPRARNGVIMGLLLLVNVLVVIAAVTIFTQSDEGVPQTVRLEIDSDQAFDLTVMAGNTQTAAAPLQAQAVNADIDPFMLTATAMIVSATQTAGAFSDTGTCQWNATFARQETETLTMRLREARIMDTTAVVDYPCGTQMDASAFFKAVYLSVRVSSVNDEQEMGDSAAAALAVLANSPEVATDADRPLPNVVNLLFIAEDGQFGIWHLPLDRALEIYQGGARGTNLKRELMLLQERSRK